MTKALLGSVVFCTAASCAYAPRIVHLEPLPIVSALKFPHGLCVEMQELADGRTEQSVIGTARNGLGMKTGEVRTYSDLPGWITKQLRRGLESAGGGECTEESPRYVLSGRLTESYVDEYWDLEGKLTTQLALELDGNVLFEKRFEAQHSQVSHSASTSEFTDVLFKTMQNLATQVTDEIVGKVGVVSVLERGELRPAVASTP